MTNVIPFKPASPNRFTRADVEAIKAQYTREVATGAVGVILWVGEDDGDCVHVYDPEQMPLRSYGKQDGRVHVIDGLGRVLAEGSLRDALATAHDS